MQLLWMINNWLFVCLTLEIKGLYSLMIFAKHIIVHKIVKFKYFAKVITYNSPDHVLQIDIF